MFFSFLYNSAASLFPLITTIAIVGIGAGYVYYQKVKQRASINSSQNKIKNNHFYQLSLDAKIAKVSDDLDEIKSILLENIHEIAGNDADFCRQMQRKVDALYHFQSHKRQETIISSKISPRKP